MIQNKVLVTGASGFVGTYLVKQLIQQKVPVRAMVRDAYKGVALEEMGAEVVLADMTDKESLRKAVDGIKGIYHIASIFRQAGLPESEFRDVNAKGTQRLFDVAIEAGVERIIHCSTVGVLGHVEHPPADENTPYNPGDMYQRTKMEGEQIALDYYRTDKMQGVVIRPAMIYGPGDSRTLKLFKMIAQKQFFYVGKGNALVHWIDVRDLVKAFILAMKKSVLNGEVYIIAGEKAVPLNYFVEMISQQLRLDPPKIHLPVKPMQWLGSLCEAICTPFGINPPIFRRRVDFFTKDRSFDTSKAHKYLGFVPAQHMDQEVAEIIRHYLKNGDIKLG